MKRIVIASSKLADSQEVMTGIQMMLKEKFPLVPVFIESSDNGFDVTIDAINSDFKNVMQNEAQAVLEIFASGAELIEFGDPGSLAILLNANFDVPQKLPMEMKNGPWQIAVGVFDRKRTAQHQSPDKTFFKQESTWEGVTKTVDTIRNETQEYILSGGDVDIIIVKKIVN